MKLNLLLLSSLEASKLYFGRNGCEYGPSYWCENISKAHECGEGAKQFCIENRWNEPSAPDEVCETCKTAVGLVHMYLTDKKYVDNIISFSVQDFEVYILFSEPEVTLSICSTMPAMLFPMNI